MLYYKIVPKCNPGLVLARSLQESSAAELLADSDQEKDRKLWSPIEIISGNYKGFALVNKHSQKVLAAPQDKAALVEISPDVDLITNRAVWQFKGLGYGAIQLQANDAMNLNVFGNGPYNEGNAVGVWDWSRGKDNEVWEMKTVISD